jgi:D-alanyl-lipoteichoic acid acyltransferase DltB (MBOAT superfamily)
VLFHSFSYLLIFLPVVVAVHSTLRTRVPSPWPQTWLLLASLFFYTRSEAANPLLLVGSILFNWAIARAMMAQTDASRRKRYLWAGLSINIIILFLFKYIHLFLETIAYFHGPRLSFPSWGFPLGVSFFTLTQIMYLVDAYPRAPSSPAARKLFRGLTAANSLFDHATFVTFFPYVISGPISRVRQVVPQLRAYSFKQTPSDMLCRGLFLFSMGLAKKVVIGDAFGTIADAGFSAVSNYSTLEAWIFSLAALFHLYFDFSGYSDMAVGSAWMLGIDIPQNFNAPLRARSISEFWQRWHISLSNFITEYLYNPLLRAMGRPTLATSAVAIILAMTIAALWHGPAWTFVAWGLSHGIALAGNQVWTRRKLEMPGWLGWVVTFTFLSSTIVFLRATSLAGAAHMLSCLLPHPGILGHAALEGLLPASPTALLRPIGVGIVIAFFFPTSTEYATTSRLSLRTAFASAFLIVASLFAMNSAPARPFVYFAF